MSVFLTLAFLFFIGSLFGWVLELFYRRFFSSANPERKWINPGFCIGPYVPLYGFGLCLLYLIATLEQFTIIQDPVWEKVALFAFMAVCMTAIEYIAGILCLKIMHVRLWDYSRNWGNIQGLICPEFSAAWAALGAVYYFFIHPHILQALNWLSENLAFSFVVGMFFGVFIIDFTYSAHLVTKIRKFANENGVVVKYENLKAYIRSSHDKLEQKSYFLFPFRSESPLSEHLKLYHVHLSEIHERIEQAQQKIHSR